MTRTITILAIAASLTGFGWAYGGEIADKAPLCQLAPKAANLNLPVPQGAIWKSEMIRVAEAPEQFGAIVGWVNVATVLPCTAPGVDSSVEIRKIRLIEADPEADTETVIKEIDFKEGRRAFEGRLFPRVPQWFGVTEGTDHGVTDGIRKNALLIDVSGTPDRVYHGWTAPRAASKPGHSYYLEVEARISGAARLQLGADYWVDLEAPYNGYEDKCNGTNNCEAWISRWFGDTDGKFVTLRAPKSF